MGLMPEKMSSEKIASGKDPARYTDETDGNVSPEEQAQYSEFEQNMLTLLYVEGGEVQPGVLEALQTGDAQAPEQEGQATPPHILTLANAAVEITKRLDDTAREAGQPLSDDVLFHGGTAVIEELAEIAEAAGIHEYTEDDLQGALTVAMDMYREKAIADGRTDEETLKGQWNEVLEADQAGNLDSVVPGLSEGAPEQAE